MANYLLTSCDELTQIVVNPGENIIAIGNVYYINFTGETDPGCFTVTDESSSPIEEGVSSAIEYNNCLACLQENNWSFSAVSCDNPILGGPVNSNQFDRWPIGQFYKLCANNGEFDGCLCFEIVSITPINYIYNFDITGPFSDCDCEIPPRSANTETFICVPDCEFTGSTAVTPPHPVWTDAYGTEVTQLNMITIGGNGLNG